MIIRVSIFILLFVNVGFGQNVPHSNAHAHNDYEHKRPLFDALDHGFTSIEADVYAYFGKLLVSHEKPTSQARTLDDLYLKPIDSLLAANNGVIYVDYAGPVYLMIDFKTEASSTYATLLKSVQQYPAILKSLEHNGQFKIFISGNRPVKEILASPANLLSLDGRPEDLGKDISSEKMPVVSESFAKYSRWNGVSAPDQEEMNTINKLAHRAHLENKKLRLWGAPDTEAAWDLFMELGIDLINTDKLAGLDSFLQAK